MVIEREPARRKKESERGFAYPSHEEKRRLNEPRQWLATKQNLARLSSIDQREEEEQEQEQRRKTCVDSDEVNSLFIFLFFILILFYFCNLV